MLDVHLRVPPELVADADAAATSAGIGGLTPAALIRLALARLANWPDSAAASVARGRTPRDQVAR